MDLKAQIEKDFLEAYKAKQELEISVLRMLKSSLKNAEISAGHPLAHEEIIKVLRKEVKQRDESSAEYSRGGNTEAAQKERNEAEIIQKYLPAQLSEEDVRKSVKEIIEEMGASSMQDMGKVMGFAMKKLGNDADGAMVSRVVRELLG